MATPEEKANCSNYKGQVPNEQLVVSLDGHKLGLESNFNDFLVAQSELFQMA